MKSTILLILACSIAGCGGEPRPPLEVRDISLYAPLPGTSMSVAYMVFENTTESTIVVSGFSSPQFSRIELHETQITDGVARMRRLDELTVPPHAIAVLEENRKHLMLMQPLPELDVDDPVTLRIAYGDSGMLIVSAPLRARFEIER